MTKIDPLEPFVSKTLLNELVSKLRNFKYKLYGKIPIKFYRGKPDKYEFDIDLGVTHFTEQDFRGLSKIFSDMNKKWKTIMTYCIYPAKKKRAIIVNVRGSPRASFDIS